MNLFDDNIIVFILLIGFLYLFFQSKKRIVINESENIYIEHEVENNFIQSNIFKGKMYNYVFKMGEKGLGYYLDLK